MIQVQQDSFNVGDTINTFCDVNSNSGGIATFLGQVRDFQGEQENPSASIAVLELEHYPGMTERELDRLEKEALQRWPLDSVFIVHRYGKMKPGDPIVLVCAASAHRGDAFSACEFLMDQLKTNAPFWKRETTDTGSSWVSARETDETRAGQWSSKT